MATWHPTEEAIENVISILDVDRREAVMRLKNNNNNVDQTINEYYDNPNSGSAYKWDESQFASDRDGIISNTGFTYQVQGPDDHAHGQGHLAGYYPGAPSRPPSRVNNRSPLNSNIISLSEEHAAANPLNSMTQDEINDPQLRQALEQSARESGLPPQQYGVTNGANEVYFGPATRNNHDLSQWAMVPVGDTSGQNMQSNPTPTERRRQEGAPAYLLASSDQHRMGPLLTIYHEIPLAREVLLSRNFVLPEYGYNPDWWSGKGINDLNVDWDTNVASGDQDYKDVAHEIQRLIAFLDSSERSYASVEALAELRTLNGLRDDANMFTVWRLAQQGDENTTALFSRAIQPTTQEDTDSFELEASSRSDSPMTDLSSKVLNFAMLDLQLPLTTGSPEIVNLYDLVDSVLWQSSGLNVSESAYIDPIGEVVAFRLTGSANSRNVQIPAIWYPDRYLESGREASADMRIRKEAVRLRLDEYDQLTERLTTFTTSAGKTVQIKEVLQSCLLQDAFPVPKDIANEEIGEGDVMEMTPEPRAGDKMNITEELKKVIASIDGKLQALEVEKEKAREALRELSKLYTEPSTEPDLSPKHPYLLCGISMTKETTYVRRYVEPDLIDVAIDESSDLSSNQWWRITFIAQSPSPVTVERVTEAQVLQAAMKESKSPIIVYASQKAMETSVEPLPEALQRFIRADNLAFSVEFPDVTASSPSAPTASPTSATSPSSPNKRKYDDGNADTRWGGLSPAPTRPATDGDANAAPALAWGEKGEDIVISHRELSFADDSDTTPMSFEGATELPLVIEGEDPTMQGMAGLTPTPTSTSVKYDKGRDVRSTAMEMDVGVDVDVPKRSDRAGGGMERFGG